MKLTKKYFIIAALFLVAVLVFIKSIIGLRGQNVISVSAEIGNVEDYYTEEGTLSFGGEYVLMAKVSGPVKEVCVEENSQVKAGDILFIIDDKDYQYEKEKYQSNIAGLQAQLEQSQINQLQTSSPQEYLNAIKSEMDKQEANYQSAKTIYDGSGALFNSESISKVEWEKAKADYESARSAWKQSKERYQQSQEMLAKLKESGIDQQGINAKFYDSAIMALSAEIQSQETALAQTEDKLTDCTVVADRDGIITSLPVKEMSIIQTGTAAVYVSSYDKVEAQARVLTSIAPYIRKGDPVIITLKLRGKDQIYKGTISKVYDFATEGTSALGLDEYRVQIKADLTGQEELIGRSGYDVSMQFLLYKGKDKLLLPVNAVFNADKQDYVFKIEGGKAVKTPVEIEYKAGTQAVIASGIDQGTRVIANADESGIYDGAKIYE